MSNDESPLARLQKNLEADNADAARKARRGVVIQGVVLVILFSYMTFLYNQIGKLTAEEVVEILGTEAQNQADPIKDALVVEGKKIAPDAMAKFKDYLMQLPEQGKEFIVSRAADRTRNELPAVELKLDTVMTEMVDEQMETVEAGQFDESGTKDKLQDVFDRMRFDYTENVKALMTDLYGRYRERIMDMDHQLIRLATAPDLNEEERLQKELIEVWMVLMNQHRIIPVVDPDPSEERSLFESDPNEPAVKPANHRDE